MSLQAAGVMKVPFVDLRMDREIEAEVLAGLRHVVERSAFVFGADLSAFEEQFAAFCGTRHAIGVANGTDALMLALKALGVGEGQDVVTSANTFVATLEAIVHAGARPLLVDVDPQTCTLDIAETEKRLTRRTRAIIPVHMFGCPADMAPLLELAKRKGLAVIEDAAQAHGGEYRGRRVGALGHAACFSFYPSKNLGAWGDAGAVTTNDREIALSIRRLRHHGSSAKYDHQTIGYNSRLDTIQAAVLRVKLRYLDSWNARRRDHAELYRSLLEGLPDVVFQTVPEGARHVYHLFVIRLTRRDRDALKVHLQQAGIETGIHYPIPVHLTPAFAWLGYGPGAFPVAEACARTTLSLPMYPGLSAEQIRYVVQCIGQFLQAKS